MKQIKKIVVALLCICTLFTVGCGTKENANDNGNRTTNTEGVMEDVGEGIDKGVRDTIDGVEDTADHIAGKKQNPTKSSGNTTTKK
ncbi:hypothetical protein [Faecalimonas sp.]